RRIEWIARHANFGGQSAGTAAASNGWHSRRVLGEREQALEIFDRMLHAQLDEPERGLVAMELDRERGAAELGGGKDPSLAELERIDVSARAGCRNPERTELVLAHARENGAVFRHQHHRACIRGHAKSFANLLAGLAQRGALGHFDDVDGRMAVREKSIAD